MEHREQKSFWMKKEEIRVWVTKAVGERLLERRDLQKRSPDYLKNKTKLFPWITSQVEAPARQQELAGVQFWAYIPEAWLRTNLQLWALRLAELVSVINLGHQGVPYKGDEISMTVTEFCGNSIHNTYRFQAHWWVQVRTVCGWWHYNFEIAPIKVIVGSLAQKPGSQMGLIWSQLGRPLCLGHNLKHIRRAWFVGASLPLTPLNVEGGELWVRIHPWLHFGGNPCNRTCQHSAPSHPAVPLCVWLNLFLCVSCDRVRPEGSTSNPVIQVAHNNSNSHNKGEHLYVISLHWPP